MILYTPEKPPKRTHGNPEAHIQADCVLWLWNTYPETRGLYFCVNNENSRSKYESRKQQLRSGAQRKALGIVPGVSDTILMIPRKGYHALCIEFKTPTGRQSESQKLFQERLERMTYRYEIVRSLEDFITVINSYLSIT